MIQLVMLRDYTSGGVTKKTHRFFSPPITAGSVQDLFEDPTHYAEKIPADERWNVYFTAGKTKPGTRDFIEQDIIPFDVDNIDVDQKEKYIEPICSVLGLPSDEVGVVFSGNGLQLMVGLKTPFKDKQFFVDNRDSYKSVCEKINKKLTEFGLPGTADPSVFSPARILRMPETVNRKPNKPERTAKVLRSVILGNGFDLESLSDIPNVKRGESMGSYDFKRHPTPDTAAVLSGCEFLKYLKKGSHTEPEWYAGLSILGRLSGGRALAHEYSRDHAGYSESEVDKKLAQAMESSGPRNCSNIGALWGKCGTCSNFQKVKNPISIKSDGFVPEKVGNRITEGFVVKRLMEELGENMTRKGKDIFSYQNGVWRHFDVDKEMTFKGQIRKLFGGEGKSKDAESAFNAFRCELPVASRDMFSPSPSCINFLNGTLHVFQKNDGSYGKEFKPHSMDDFLINQLPYNYDPDSKAVNKPFNEMLWRLFGSNPDRHEKVMSIGEMYGSCLLPIFPHIFMLHGAAATGKTSIILPIFQFLKMENVSCVEPHEFFGFQMESMAGKLVNIVTDINTKKPIEDANLKKIEDRVPIKIDRKYQSAIYAPLPAVHIFCGNAIPPTLEGTSRAHTRRWTFIEFNSFQPGEGWDKNFANRVFNECPEGVLNFALDGLNDLLAKRGHFMQPTSGRESLAEWMTAGDVVQQFLNDIEHGEVKCDLLRNGNPRTILMEKDAKLPRTPFYEAFQKWFEDAGHDRFRGNFNNIMFFKALKDKGYEVKKTEGIRFIKGFELEIVSEAGI